MKTQSKHVNGVKRDQVTTGFSFASDWLRGWREYSYPITERSKAKPMQYWITFHTQLKSALNFLLLERGVILNVNSL